MASCSDVCMFATEPELRLLFSLLTRSRSTRRWRSAISTMGADRPFSPGALVCPGKAAFAMAEYCGGPYISVNDNTDDKDPWIRDNTSNKYKVITSGIVISTLEDAWLLEEVEREPKLELLDILSVLADRERSWPSRRATLRKASRIDCNKICFSSCSFKRSAMVLLEASSAWLRSFSKRWIFVRTDSISGLVRDLGAMLRSSRNSCSFSWMRSNRSLSDSLWPGAILSSSSAIFCCKYCKCFLASSYCSLVLAISARRVPIGAASPVDPLKTKH